MPRSATTIIASSRPSCTSLPRTCDSRIRASDSAASAASRVGMGSLTQQSKPRLSGARRSSPSTNPPDEPGPDEKWDRGDQRDERDMPIMRRPVPPHLGSDPESERREQNQRDGQRRPIDRPAPSGEDPFVAFAPEA